LIAETQNERNIMPLMPTTTVAEPTAVAVTGGAGALGLHFVRHVLNQTSLPVRVLLHRTQLPADLKASRLVQVRGSLLDSASLDEWLCPGAAVVHLAWSSSMSDEEHNRSVGLLTDAAARHDVARFVHCSTAVVVGRTRAAVVTEDTPCAPVTEYERSKLEVERAIEAAAAGRFPLTILRPTAVFGPGLQNLVNLIESLRNGRQLVNYARASLFGRRNLHLVPVETVVGALLFAALGQDSRERRPEPVRYIVSADEEPGGDFRAIERRIRHGLGLAPPPPPVRIPSVGLRLMLTATGRSDTNPYRRYDGSRLRQAGFVPPMALEEAVDRYVAWYRANSRACDTE
jgi:nucleoside-diphosphate-sugar epimerase